MSDAPGKPPPIRWETIERVADRAEMDRVAALSDAQVEGELRKAGIDPDRVEAMLREALERAGQPAAAPAAGDLPAALAPSSGARAAARDDASAPALAVPVDEPSEPMLGDDGRARRGKVRSLATPPRAMWRSRSWMPVLAAAAAVVAVFAYKQREREADRDLAARVREQAFPACAAGQWAACEDGLDRAKKLDPAGESDPRVQAARERAAERQQEPPPQAPTTSPPLPPPSSQPAPQPTPSAAPLEEKPSLPVHHHRPGPPTGDKPPLK